MIKQIFLSLFSLSLSRTIQGPMSVSKAILVWENLQQYTELFELKLINFEFNPKNHTSLSEELYRYKIDCPVCEKGFKNSSFMVYHYYRNHLTTEEID